MNPRRAENVIFACHARGAHRKRALEKPRKNALRADKLARMHFIIIAVVVLGLWGVWRLIRAQIEKGADAQDESVAQLPQVMDADAGKSDQS